MKELNPPKIPYDLLLEEKKKENDQRDLEK
jgi:hypothetical protein